MHIPQQPYGPPWPIELCDSLVTVLGECWDDTHNDVADRSELLLRVMRNPSSFVRETRLSVVFKAQCCFQVAFR